MKEKIIIFLTGLLLGSIISTGSIYIYTIANNSNNNVKEKMPEQGEIIENKDSPPPELPKKNTN